MLDPDEACNLIGRFRARAAETAGGSWRAMTVIRAAKKIGIEFGGPGVLLRSRRAD